MTAPNQTGSRDLVPVAVAGVLFLLLVVSARDILIPPVVFPLLLLVAWPLRGRPGVQAALSVATLLTLLWALQLYGGLLGPFLLALAVAYLLAPLVARLERRGVGRGLAILIVCVPPAALGVALLLIAGPQVWAQAVALVNALPRMATTTLDALERLRAWLEGLRFLTPGQRSWIHQFDAQQLATLIQQNGDDILRGAAAWGWALVRRLGTLVGFLGYAVVTPVVAFYVLRDWRRLIGFLEELIPPSRRGGLVDFIGRYDANLGRFFRGQLIEATLVGTLTGAGLGILGVPNALLLGVTAGLCNLLPYVGLFISLIPAVVVALTMDSPLGGLARVAIVFAVVQFLDGSVTGPRIVGRSVGLHPAVIMLALAVGGTLLGFAGLLLAVPLALLIKMLGQVALERYRQSAVYGGREDEAARG
jgi:predicted PurR-regulated permease PerM